jgi:chromosome transmission fidelity protein 18
MGLADAFDIKAKKDQQYILQHYIPYAAVAIHRTCCTSTRRRVEYPRSSYVAQQQREKSINILDALVENSRLSPSIRCGAGVLVTDVVPWLLGTLCPNIRKLNTSLQTVVEKASMHRLIELMSNLGLSYRPKYLPDGTEDYALEP